MTKGRGTNCNRKRAERAFRSGERPNREHTLTSIGGKESSENPVPFFALGREHGSTCPPTTALLTGGIGKPDKNGVIETQV